MIERARVVRARPIAPRLDATLVWFRRDLRSYDHAALYHALSQARRVYCAFVFDTEILDALENRADRRVEFIWESVAELSGALQRAGGGLIVRHARARDEIPALAARLGVQAVYANHDYEPRAIERDLAVARALAAAGRELRTFKDQVIFEREEVMTRAGTPFSVFTPYKNAWLARLQDADVRPYPVERHLAALAPLPDSTLPALEALGFARTNLRQLRMPTGMSGARALFEDFRRRMSQYRERRDYPAMKGPSYLSVHLRFGTISVRELVRAARTAGDAGASTWLSELIWRDFYFMILFHHPHVVEHAFRPGLDALRFGNDEGRWRAWCRGATGYPLVDAAMRQLNQTGTMHNRLRMLAASFLVKHLQVDWRRGERYFARQLNDYDLAANNGGWQWAASTGCDAQPWFRIFNPVTQSRRFDAHGKFIRLYLPELAHVPDGCIHAPWTMDEATQARVGVRIGRDYPAPIVDHAQARKAALEMWKGVTEKR
ncbi:MAG TPA: deoxyribodipyrimidine photo-lyase, partial [Burkholderiales bacterium]|nr:deoxyribodipyrimidine photo-lyase [Burkholderiales bacterium]